MTCSFRNILKLNLAGALLLSGMSLTHAASAQIQFRGIVTGKPNETVQATSSSTVSFTDKAAFRLKSANPGSEYVSVRFESFDSESRPLESVTLPKKLVLEPGMSAMSTVIVPLHEFGTSTVRICSIHSDRTGTVTNHSCADYTANRIALSE